jgi:RNA polymerase sigma-70 factor, ECF subfamily
MLQHCRPLLEKHHRESYLWALRCCAGNPEDAKEVLQETYLKVLEGKARFDEKSAFKTWLFGVIRFTTADFRRKKIVEDIKFLELRDLFSRLTSKQHYEIGLNEEEAKRELLQSLSQLSARQEQILRLVFYHEFTIEEAAKIMGVSVGAARKHYERGKANLKIKIKL